MRQEVRKDSRVTSVGAVYAACVVFFFLIHVQEMKERKKEEERSGPHNSIKGPTPNDLKISHQTSGG